MAGVPFFVIFEIWAAMTIDIKLRQVSFTGGRTDIPLLPTE